jgi:uncharacterized protein (DUF433 family)
MLTAIKGTFRDGRVELDEDPGIIGEARVLVTFLQPEPLEQTRKAVRELMPSTDAIRRTEGVVGGDARVRNTRIPVWTLVQFKKLGRTGSQLLDDFPGLTREDLDAAWQYYRDHTDEIEQAIASEAAED